ncbi:Hypothetical protein, DUF 402 family [Metamycoplasma auris 15026]|uniref:DUF402 domain-containing protein n=1 Tax=Metamycoplasma auris 15026 TaxID=1188233 RepID=N9V1E9_9BACT|nr:DUF402 domain-containing protein [Metamycoplasma auris]ENY69187.1 Hypothetical protein, DUF 402 family [Metamycoplasma auris 15026]
MNSNQNKSFHDTLQQFKINKKQEFFQLGQITTIQAFKYDGTLYRQYEGCKIIANWDEFVVVLLMKTKVQEININWIVSTPMLFVFSKKHFYNAMITLNSNDQNNIYINLASPFFIENEIIKYIDFDLDIKCYGQDDFNVVDWHDFKKSITDFRYPLKLIYKIYNELDVLEKKRKNKEGIFAKSFISDIKKILREKGDL